MKEIIPIDTIQQKILLVRGHKVMIDKDLAVLYDVKPIRLREQVRRNLKRFPKDFMFQLNKKRLISWYRKMRYHRAGISGVINRTFLQNRELPC